MKKYFATLFSNSPASVEKPYLYKKSLAATDYMK